MYYGCEQPIEVAEGENVEIKIPALPVYTGGTWWYTPWSEVAYPDCPAPLPPLIPRHIWASHTAGCACSWWRSALVLVRPGLNSA